MARKEGEEEQRLVDLKFKDEILLRTGGRLQAFLTTFARFRLSKIEQRKGRIPFVGLVLFLHLTAVGLSAIITCCLDFWVVGLDLPGRDYTGHLLPPSRRKKGAFPEGGEISSPNSYANRGSSGGRSSFSFFLLSPLPVCLI